MEVTVKESHFNRLVLLGNAVEIHLYLVSMNYNPVTRLNAKKKYLCIDHHLFPKILKGFLIISAKEIGEK